MFLNVWNWQLSTTQVQVVCTQTWRSVQIFCDLLTDHPRSALRSSRHVSEEHDKRVPSVHWWSCYATLTRAEMVGYIQIPVVFSSIELLFPILAGDIANVTIAQIPLIPDPPPARNPPPAVIRQKGSACSVTRLLVIIVTTSIVQWSPVLCMSMQALAG